MSQESRVKSQKKSTTCITVHPSMLNPCSDQCMSTTRRVKRQETRDRRLEKTDSLRQDNIYTKKRYKKLCNQPQCLLRDARRNISVTETIFQLEGVISGTESLKQRVAKQNTTGAVTFDHQRPTTTTDGQQQSLQTLNLLVAARAE